MSSHILKNYLLSKFSVSSSFAFTFSFSEVAAMSESRDEVAKRLHLWASKEMHFIPQGKYVNTPMPSAEDFRE